MHQNLKNFTRSYLKSKMHILHLSCSQFHHHKTYMLKMQYHKPCSCTSQNAAYCSLLKIHATHSQHAVQEGTAKSQQRMHAQSQTVFSQFQNAQFAQGEKFTKLQHMPKCTWSVNAVQSSILMQHFHADSMCRKQKTSKSKENEQSQNVKYSSEIKSTKK